MDCPKKSVREILDAVDFWHSSWEPQGLKELKQLNSRQLCVLEHQQAHKQYPHHSWSHVVFPSILWFDSNAENKGACVPPHIMLTALAPSATFSFSPKLSGVLQVQTLIKWCRKLYPTLWNMHPDSMHAFPARGGWTGPLTFVINFLQDSSFYQLLSALPHWYFPFQGCNKTQTEKRLWIGKKKKKMVFREIIFQHIEM